MADGKSLQIIDTFRSFANIEYIDSNIIRTAIPSGFRPGTYNLHVTNPNGEHVVVHNAFTIIHGIMINFSHGLNFFGLPDRI